MMKFVSTAVCLFVVTCAFAKECNAPNPLDMPPVVVVDDEVVPPAGDQPPQLHKDCGCKNKGK